MPRIDRETVRQLIKFGLVGVANTVVYNVFYWLFLLFMHYVVAMVIAYVISVVFSFFMNCHFTYHVRPTWRRFLLFPLSTLVNFLFTTVGAIALVEWAGFSEFWAPLVAGIAAIPFTFVTAKYVLTGKHNPDHLATEAMADAVREAEAPQAGA